jgi:ribosome maturation factor RimP
METVELDKLEGLAGPVLAGLGYELVDVEWRHEAGRWVLRVFIDVDSPDPATPEGRARVSHDDCARASHALSAELDVADLIHVPFTLEVSSPGLNRPLRRENDFRRFLGQRAKIHTRNPIGATENPPASPVGGRRNFAGTLVGAEGGIVRISVEGQIFDIAVDNVDKANLVFEF